MQRTHLGEFEELVLLIVGALQDNAYSMAIRTELANSADRKPSIGALHAALNRLEDKGYISSFEGGATSERGGRRKRFYEITDAGKSVLRNAYELRTGWYKLIPGLS